MKLLAVETATEACSAALLIDGNSIERFEVAPQKHTSLILPMIASLLAEAGIQQTDLDGLAFGCGPGSFTGVRIATGIIQGIAFGLDLPVVPVSTLAALSQDFFNRQTDIDVVFSALDARLGEIFWGAYQRNADGYAQSLIEESVTPALNALFPDVTGVGIGSGWAVYATELLLQSNGKVKFYEAEHWPHAKTIAQLAAYGFTQGLAVPAEQAMPVYLRNKVAKTEAERA